jgi:hypothetical protein
MINHNGLTPRALREIIRRRNDANLVGQANSLSPDFRYSFRGDEILIRAAKDTCCEVDPVFGIDIPGNDEGGTTKGDIPPYAKAGMEGRSVDAGTQLVS